MVSPTHIVAAFIKFAGIEVSRYTNKQIPQISVQMNRLLPKVLIFLTFFGSCIVIGLLLSALVTNSWVVSGVTFISPVQSSGNATATTRNQFGTVEIGLFDYTKSLNHGYGMRHENFSMAKIFDSEESFMDYWLWMFTALCTGFGLFNSAIAAVSSVIGTIKQKGGMGLMIISNVLSAISLCIACGCWVVNFYRHLQHNVLFIKDERTRWSSKGQASFGFSFYFVILAFGLVVLNLILLYSATRVSKRHRKRSQPIEEKEGNSIMLY